MDQQGVGQNDPRWTLDQQQQCVVWRAHFLCFLHYSVHLLSLFGWKVVCLALSLAKSMCLVVIITVAMHAGCGLRGN